MQKVLNNHDYSLSDFQDNIRPIKLTDYQIWILDCLKQGDLLFHDPLFDIYYFLIPRKLIKIPKKKVIKKPTIKFLFYHRYVGYGKPTKNGIPVYLKERN